MKRAINPFSGGSGTALAGSDQEVTENDRLTARWGTPMADYLSDLRYSDTVPGPRELVPSLCPHESDMIPHIYPAFHLTGCHSLSPPGSMHVDQIAPWRYDK